MKNDKTFFFLVNLMIQFVSKLYSVWHASVFSYFEFQVLEFLPKGYIDGSGSNALHIFPWKLQHVQRAQQRYLIEQIFGLEHYFFSMWTLPLAMHFWQQWTTACVPLSWKCTSRGEPLLPLLKCTIHHLIVLIPTVWTLYVFSNVTGCLFFLCGGIHWLSLLHMHFHVRHHFVRLPLCCHLLLHNSNMEWNIGRKVQLLLPCHQQPPVTSQTNLIT